MTFQRVCIAFPMALDSTWGWASSWPGSPLQRVFERIVLLFQSIPSAIQSIVAIIWFGIVGLAPVFVIWAIPFPVLALNVFEGREERC